MQIENTGPAGPPLPRAAIKPLAWEYESRFEPDDRKFISALARGMDILRAFQTRTGALSNKEIAAITGIPKPTVTRMTYTLMELGYLVQNRSHGKYELGAGILSLGYPLLSGLRIRHVAHDHMAELAHISGCSVALASRDKLSMVYVDECCGNSSTTLRVDIGARIELVRSAIGRAWLAGVPEAERNTLYREFEPIYGEEWPALLTRIQDAIHQVEERGFCLVDQEWRKDTRTVAVPLISPDGKTFMAMACGAPSFTVSVEKLEQDLGPRLVHIGKTISLFLGN